MTERSGLPPAPVSRRRRFRSGNLETGEVLRVTFSVFGQNFGPFIALALVALLPDVALTLFVNFSGVAEDIAAGELGPLLAALAVFVLVAMVAIYLVQGFAITAVSFAIRGMPVDLGRCISTGVNRLGPMLGTAIAAFVLALLGLLACVIPGIMISIALAVAIPVVVVEGCGVGDALKRSAALTSGHRWTVFVILLVLGLIGGVATAPFNVASRMASSPAAMQVIDLLSSGVGAVFTVIQSIAIAVIYHHLRFSKDGADVDEVARAFD